ncbi:hypothetical protein GCM10007941_16590 [Amphritea balenae]|nr:hypothetical protein GCM10007941_16590 [Amphritea balenae]
MMHYISYNVLFLDMCGNFLKLFYVLDEQYCALHALDRREGLSPYSDQLTEINNDKNNIGSSENEYRYRPAKDRITASKSGL